MSASPLKADIASTTRNVGYGPTTDISVLHLKKRPTKTALAKGIGMFGTATPLLRVKSVVGVERFYCDGLGFSIKSSYRGDLERADPAYLVLCRDDAVLHLSSFPRDGAIGHVVTIAVSDIECLRDQLVAKGIDIGNGVMDQDWGDRELYVRDGDENCIRFQATRP